jgi:chemotaxis protein CheD
MLHRESGMASMCHCLLAAVPHGKPLSEEGSRFYYLDWALEEMLAFFGRGGVRPQALEVKLFGGADVLPVFSGRRTVGQGNLESAKRLAARFGLEILASDIGGQVGRKITFMTETGNVLVRRLRPLAEQLPLVA